MKLFKSKRFIAFAVSVVLYVGMIFLTNFGPMEIAGSISTIVGVYIGAETIKPSTPIYMGKEYMNSSNPMYFDGEYMNSSNPEK